MAHPWTRRALFAGATAAPACISMPTAAAPARHPDAEIFAALGRLDALYGVYDELIAISAKLTPGTEEHDASADRVAENGELVEAGLMEVRSEERRVGKESVSTCRLRSQPDQ